MPVAQSVAFRFCGTGSRDQWLKHSSGTPLVLSLRTLGPIAEQVRMDFPEDLGQRIVEATRLAVMLHIQHSLHLESIPGGTGRATGGAAINWRPCRRRSLGDQRRSFGSRKRGRMIYGLYLSASGVLANSYRQDVIANNIANSETVGFKKDLAVLQQRSTAAREPGDRGRPILCSSRSAADFFPRGRRSIPAPVTWSRRATTWTSPCKAKDFWPSPPMERRT